MLRALERRQVEPTAIAGAHDRRTRSSGRRRDPSASGGGQSPRSSQPPVRHGVVRCALEAGPEVAQPVLGVNQRIGRRLRAPEQVIAHRNAPAFAKVNRLAPQRNPPAERSDQLADGLAHRGVANSQLALLQSIASTKRSASRPPMPAWLPRLARAAPWPARRPSKETRIGHRSCGQFAVDKPCGCRASATSAANSSAPRLGAALIGGKVAEHRTASRPHVGRLAPVHVRRILRPPGRGAVTRPSHAP